MKKTLFVAIALTALLQSCGDRSNSKSSSYQNKITLGKFADIVSTSTFDEAKLTDLPRSINLKAEMSPVKNQGSRGACTFFSTAAMLEATIKKDMNTDVNLSEEYMNYASKSNGFLANDEGSTVLLNLYGIKSGGLMLENDSSYQPSWFDKGLPCEKFKSSDLNAPPICFSHNKPDAESLKKIIPVDNINFRGMEKNTNDIIRFLAEEKRPITLGMVVNFNGWPDNGEAYYDESLRAECLKDESKCGGHSVLITGYDLDKKVFYFKNSWGKEWGQEGYGTITINSVDRYAGNDFYIANLTGDLKIPDNKFLTPVIVKSMSSTSKIENDNLSISVSAEVTGAKGNLIYVSSFIVKKVDMLGELVDNNMALIPTSPDEAVAIDEQYIRAIQYITDPKADTLQWTEEAPLILNFMKGTEKSIKTAIDSSEERLLRTTIYIHTDVDSWKVLKREYRPITK